MKILEVIKANKGKVLIALGTIVGLAVVGNMVSKNDEESEVEAQETTEQVESEVEAQQE